MIHIITSPLQMKQGQYSELGNSQYQLMTSVSMPVYDLRHNEVSSSSCCKLALIYMSPNVSENMSKIFGKENDLRTDHKQFCLIQYLLYFLLCKVYFLLQTNYSLISIIIQLYITSFPNSKFPCSMNQINLSSVSKRCVYRLVLYFLLIGRKLYLF